MSTGLALGTVAAGVALLIPGGAPFAALAFAGGNLIGNLLDPPKVEIPEPNATKVQLSEYGRPIPMIFGLWRLAGTVIWMKWPYDKHQERSGGKGSTPSSTSTTYSTSMAILLCEGPIDSVLKVWADGKLIWPNAEGAYDFTLYNGTEDQLPDPTMEAELGVGQVPAHRGYAYVVFADLPLKEFGERPPQFEFLVATTPASSGLRIVKSNYETGSGVFSNMPIIVDWPSDGDIVIAANSLSPDPITTLVNAKAFSNGDLSYIGPAVATGLTFPSFWDDGSRQGLGYHVYTGGSRTPLWISHVFGSYKVENAVVTPGDGVTNFLEDAGVPGAEYVCGCCLTQDGTRFYAFTDSISGGAVNADTWYEIIDGMVARTGTVDPPLALGAYGNNTRPHGTGSPADAFGRTMSAENNAEYFWYLNNTTAAEGTVSIYRIDGDGNFAEWTGGTIQAGWATSGEDAGVEASLQTLSREGYCGAFRGNSLVLFSRLGTNGGVPLGDIVSAVSAKTPLLNTQYDTASLTPIVPGFQIGAQMEAANALQPLRQRYKFDAVERDGKVVFVMRGGSPVVTIEAEELAARPNGDEPPAIVEISVAPEGEAPRRVFVEFVDNTFDYQKGSEYSPRQVTDATSDTTVVFPIAMPPSEAKEASDALLWEAHEGRKRYRWWTPRTFLLYDPTDPMIVDGLSVAVETQKLLANGIIEWEGVATRGGLYEESESEQGGGSSVGEQPEPAPKVRTQLVLLDIPVLSLHDAPFGFYAAMGPASPGPWPGAGLYKSLDDGETWKLIATTSFAETIGSTLGALGDYIAGSPPEDDTTSSVDVFLTNPLAELESATEEAFQNGANLCAIRSGALWEICQYRDATLIDTDSEGRKTYTIGGAWKRGLKGTSSTGHVTGDEFVVLPCLNVDAPQSELNVPLKYKAVTYGKSLSSAEVIEFTNTGEGEEEWSGGVDEILPSNGAGYVLTGSNAALPNARVITAGTNITLTDGGPGSTLTISASGGGGGSSPLTTKGDVYTFSTVDARLAVGSNDQVIKANSATATGLEWFTPPWLVSPLTTKGDLLVFTTTNARLPAPANGFIFYADSTQASGWNTFDLTAHVVAIQSPSYVTLGTDTLLSNERVLTAGAGVTLTDGGAGSTVTVAVPAVAAQFVTLATSSDLANERVLTAGTGISITDGGAGGNVTIACTVAAGALTVIGTVTTSGGVSTVTFSSIPGTFKDLILSYYCADSSNSFADGQAYLQVNGDNTAGNYSSASYILSTGSSSSAGGVASTSNGMGLLYCPGTQGPQSNSIGIGEVLIPGYASTMAWHMFVTQGAEAHGTSGAVHYYAGRSATWKSTAAITSLKVTATSAFRNGSIFTLYGRG